MAKDHVVMKAEDAKEAESFFQVPDFMIKPIGERLRHNTVGFDVLEEILKSEEIIYMGSENSRPKDDFILAVSKGRVIGCISAVIVFATMELDLDELSGIFKKSSAVACYEELGPCSVKLPSGWKKLAELMGKRIRVVRHDLEPPSREVGVFPSSPPPPKIKPLSALRKELRT